MNELKKQGQLVFGLDIGTRSIVGTVGYREGDVFHVSAQDVKEHETRAMLDGQIHDIGAVGNTIAQVKKNLESKLSVKLEDVCIAAAGRVLRTIETNVTWDLESETVISKEEIASLTSMAIEKAYEKFQETNDTDIKFYCVGNSVIRYYMNGYQIGNLENHKARSIGMDIIATFLPDDVVDGLYKAVELAGLNVSNMTLEPIAAISVAIPEMYRMLNIALVDVGAGTSDICITKDGCIVAYGMIPVAGDSLTEIIARNCLVDFKTAESIKMGISEHTEVQYKDIMGLPQTITREGVLELLDAQIESMTHQVSDKIKELNGDKPVSAVFVVGGGGKIEGYTDKLSGHLGIIKERVAVRGEEVMQKIEFAEETKKDSLLVTPIGICLNYYEQSNNFVYVTFNDERIKLYDNNALAVVDAAMHAGFPNEMLFPRRGKEINYSVNGVKRICRGTMGEPAVITLNGETVDLYHPIKANDVISVKESTSGADAVLPLAKIPETKGTICVKVDKSKVLLPKFPLINGVLQTLSYDVQEGDKIVLLDYYTVKQVKEFTDVTLDESMTVLVNNEPADDSTLVYDNFTIKWVLKSEVKLPEMPAPKAEKTDNINAAEVTSFEDLPDSTEEEIERSRYTPERNKEDNENKEDKENTENTENTDTEEDKKDSINSDNKENGASEASENAPVQAVIRNVAVLVNNKSVILKGKSSYVFVDVFDYIDFDRTTVKGDLIMRINGVNAEYMQVLAEGDVIEIYWDNK